MNIPDTVRAKARVYGAQRWLDELPSIVAGLAADWSLEIGRVHESATEALVVEATAAGGTPAVLKLLVPREGDHAVHEITVLRLTGGTGCVALLREDVSRGALLLERLGPSMYDLGLPIAARHEILCATVARVWRPASGSGLPTGVHKGQWLVAFIERMWESLGRPGTRRTVDHALACAGRRIAAHRDADALLVHGDVHQWNALQSGDGFKLVDPDGLLAEPAYDLGILMREDPVELMAGDPYARARWLADRTGLDATAIWEWGVVERVSTGLLGRSIGMQPVADQMLDAAERIAAEYTAGP